MSATAQLTEIDLPPLIGRGYKDFWNFKGRYRVLKGGRGSKKSTTASLWFPYNMMKYYHEYGLKPNVLVVRRYFNTHLGSTYAQLKWAIKQLGVSHLWKAKLSPLELTYIPSGQKIMFRGLDDPQSITSITVDDGELCWTWWEEAFQVMNEDDFNKVDMSIRGDMPYPYFKQHTLTFNPWSERHWLKKRFFDDKDNANIYAETRNYDCNEFLGDDDRLIFEEMKVKNPRRYSIEGLGNWGIAEGLIYENVIEREFDWYHMLTDRDPYGRPRYTNLYGMDFGYSNDPTAIIPVLVDEKNFEIYIYDEIYEKRMKNRDIIQSVIKKGWEEQIIRADHDPKTIDELNDGYPNVGRLPRVREAKKGPNSIIAGINKLQDYTIIVHPRAYNTIIEFSNYVWDKDKQTGKILNVPVDDYNHAMDALRYATEDIARRTFTFG